jgi:hypothetical protein
MTLGELNEKVLILLGMDENFPPRKSNLPVRIGPVEREAHAHETHDIDDICIKKDSLGNDYVEISEIPF